LYDGTVEGIIVTVLSLVFARKLICWAEGLPAYRLEDSWIAFVAGSQNSFTILCGSFKFLHSFGRKFFAYIQMKLSSVPREERVRLLLYAIVKIFLTLYRMRFSCRSGFSGRDRCIIPRVPMNASQCLIQKTNPDSNDVLVLSMKTREREKGTIPLSSINASPPRNRLKKVWSCPDY
jgi:hypothetical protein